MKFFTRDLWIESQNVGRNRDKHLKWEQAFSSYESQLQALRSRLDAKAYEFFAENSLHDGELLEFAMTDGSRPAPLGAPVRPWSTPTDNPVKATIAVLDAYDGFVWRLSYEKLRRVVVDYPTDDPLFHTEGQGFGDWGYHELTDAGAGFLRHEILFRSGATVLLEFKTVAVGRTPRSEAGGRETG